MPNGRTSRSCSLALGSASWRSGRVEDTLRVTPRVLASTHSRDRSDRIVFFFGVQWAGGSARGWRIGRAVRADDAIYREPDVTAFNAMLRAVSSAPQWHPTHALAVDDVLDAMEGENIAPDRETCAVVRSFDAENARTTSSPSAAVIYATRERPHSRPSARRRATVVVVEREHNDDSHDAAHWLSSRSRCYDLSRSRFDLTFRVLSRTRSRSLGICV